MPRPLSAAGLLAFLLVCSCTEPNPTFAPDAGPSCTPGARYCAGANNLVVCIGGAEPQFDLERVCPAPSVCQEGSCAPAGQPCQGTCSDGLVCSVFVAPGTTRLVTYCAQPVGPKLGDQLCSRNDECQTGLCVNGLCFRGCSKSRECPAALRCVDAKVTVDGVSGTIPACR